MSRRRRPPSLLACMFVFALIATAVLGACGDDDAREGTQPAPGVPTFEQGRFDDLPRYPRSEPLGPRTEKGGTVARSFATTGATPDAVLDWYAQTLQPRGWELSGDIHEVGTTAWRADFTRGERTLRVSAAPAPTVEKEGTQSGDTLDTQYSLTLGTA